MNGEGKAEITVTAYSDTIMISRHELETRPLFMMLVASQAHEDAQRALIAVQEREMIAMTEREPIERARAEAERKRQSADWRTYLASWERLIERGHRLTQIDIDVIWRRFEDMFGKTPDCSR